MTDNERKFLEKKMAEIEEELRRYNIKLEEAKMQAMIKKNSNNESLTHLLTLKRSPGRKFIKLRTSI